MSLALLPRNAKKPRKERKKTLKNNKIRKIRTVLRTDRELSANDREHVANKKVTMVYKKYLNQVFANGVREPISRKVRELL